MIRLSLLSVALMFFGLLRSQCVVDLNEDIEDLSDHQIKIDVSGLINSQLSDPSQGLCIVHIEFDHNSIGDWVATLASPSGQFVTLIGPTGLFSETFNTTWSVDFVACNYNATPDLGFFPNWISDQSWGNDNKYTGSYYPQSGCFEDFNSGNANGTWTLYVEDFNQIDEGNILNIELTFCDDSSMPICFNCVPNGGRFASTTIRHCQGKPRILRSSDINFVGGQSDPSIYSYNFILSSNDVITQLLPELDLSVLSTGIYDIIGLNYLSSQGSLIPSPGDLVSNFVNKLSGSTPSFCGSTTNTLRLQVVDVPSTRFIFDTICLGNVYPFYGLSLTREGQYDTIFRAPNGCDSTIILNLSIDRSTASIEGASNINCTNPTTNLTLGGITLSAVKLTRWSDSNGSLPNFDNDLSILVAEPGIYEVIFNYRGCIDTLQKSITSSIQNPIFNVSGQNINCNQDFGQVFVNTLENLTYEWSFQGSVFSNNQQDTAFFPGLYTIKATNRLGCAISKSTPIVIDTLPPSVQINGGSLACQNSVQILLDILGEATFIWNGVGGFTSRQKSPFVKNPGTYNVRIMPANGCSSREFVEVINQVRPLNLELISDTLTCIKTAVQIGISSPIAEIYSRWISPTNDTLFGNTPTLSDEGVYKLQVTNVQDGCVFDSSFQLISIANSNISGLTDLELTCSNTVVTISPIIDFIMPSSSWLFPDGRITLGDSLVTNIPGMHILRVDDSVTGCFNFDTLTVRHAPDITMPEIIYDTLSCSKDTAVFSVVDTGNLSLEWLTKNDLSLGSSNPQIFTVPDFYHLSITDTVGCKSRYKIEVPFNNNMPILTLPIDNNVLSCTNASILLSPVTDLHVEEYTWRLNGIIISKDSEILANIQGDYQLITQYSLLCSNTILQTIQGNLDPPDISILAPDNLTCNQLFADLSASSTEDLIYQWSFDQSVISNDSIVSVSRPGLYYLSTEGANSCSRIDTLEIRLDTIPENINAIGGQINCSTSKTVISADTIIPNYQYHWTGPNGFISDMPSNIVRDIGIYKLTVTATNGCISKSDFELINNIDFPELKGTGGSLSCRDGTVELRVITNIDPNGLTWFGPNGFTSTNPSPIVSQSGTYVIIAEGDNGCTSKDAVQVSPDPVLPSVEIILETFNCATQTLNAQAISPDTFAIFRWSNINGFNTVGAQVDLPSIGNYTLRTEGFDGCISITDTIVPIDTISPSFNIFTEDKLLCDISEVNLITDSLDNQRSYSFNWTTEDGLILSDISINNILVGQVGSYLLEVTDMRNFCSAEQIYDLEIGINTLSDFEFVSVDNGCASDFNGRIKITNVIGGEGPYTFSIAGEPFTDVSFFMNLLPDNYAIIVKDRFGCSLEKSILIRNTAFLEVELPEEIYIRLGDSVMISPSIESFFDLADLSYSWSPNDNLDCNDCLNPTVSPVTSGPYCLLVSNGDLCNISDCVDIIVSKSGDAVFVPDAFTPNDDATNDQLKVLFDKSIERIISFEVYSRKGHRVFQSTNGFEGWDGIFDGEELKPQVFAYKVEYIFKDGFVGSKSGTTTLLR